MLTNSRLPLAALLPSWVGGTALADSPALLPTGKADSQGRHPVEAQLRDVSVSTAILLSF